ncbi:MAG: ankyrin repeat domain-containing protein [Deltaproteobacteria bacterium]|nr:ankyrin repeat domain-containing protein [Deltaproteobacteria bacterium]
MEFAILWIETLALALIFVALIYRLSSLLKSRFLRIPIRILALLLPAFLSGAFTVFTWYLRQRGAETAWLFGFSIFWVIFFLIGFVLVRHFARKRQDTQEEASSVWRPMALIGSLAIVLLLFVGTLLKMDADARAQLASAQARALAMATTVTPEPVPWEKNAALIYKKASEHMVLPNWIYEISNPGFIPDLKETEDVIEKNQLALWLLEDAVAMPDASFVPDVGANREWPSFWSEFPYTPELRNAVRLLALDCYLKASKGKTREAIESIEALGAVARHSSRNPYLISTMMAASIIEAQKSSLERLLAFTPKTDIALLPLSLKNKCDIMALWQRSLLMEDAMTIYSFSNDLFTGKIYGRVSNSTLDNILFYALPYRALMSTYDLAFFDKSWKKSHGFASKPIYEVFQQQKEWEESVMKKPGGLISAVAGVPRLSRYSIRPHFAQAHVGLQNLALAVSAFYRENDRYPSRYMELLPGYIREIPIDPFDGKFLKMSAVDGGMILYSVGPDFKDDNGKIEYAYPYGEKKTGDILFRIGAAYDQAFLKPALPKLAARGDLEMVRRALAVGADANRNEPLVEAAQNGHDEVVRLLVEKGAGMNALSEKPDQGKGKYKRSLLYREPKIGGLTALMAASTKGHTKTVKLLIDMGANPDAVNNKGRTALMLAGGTRIVRAMEWVEYELKTLSVAKKEIQVLTAKIKELEGKGKGLFGGDEREKKLAQLWARLSKNKAHVRFLVEGRVSSQGTAQKIEKPAAATSRAPLIKLLLDAGANIHAKDAFGVTPLLSAAFEGDIDAVELLIANKADITAKNKFGWTGLIIAKATGNKAMENLLITEGASLEENDQRTILRIANSMERLQRAEKRNLKSKKRKRK